MFKKYTGIPPVEYAEESAGMMEIRWKIKGKYENKRTRRKPISNSVRGATDMTRLGGKHEF